MELIDALQGIVGTGADAATVGIAVMLLKIERRVHNVEVVTGIKKLKVR